MNFASNIYRGGITLKGAKKTNAKCQRNWKQHSKKAKISSRKEALLNARKLYGNRNEIINTFENGVLSFRDGFQKKESSMFNKKLPHWVNVSIKRFDTIKIKLKRLRIHFLYQEGQVLAFMLKIRIS